MYTPETSSCTFICLINWWWCDANHILDVCLFLYDYSYNAAQVAVCKNISLILCSIIFCKYIFIDTVTIAIAAAVMFNAFGIFHALTFPLCRVSHNIFWALLNFTPFSIYYSCEWVTASEYSKLDIKAKCWTKQRTMFWADIIINVTFKPFHRQVFVCPSFNSNVNCQLNRPLTLWKRITNHKKNFWRIGKIINVLPRASYISY